jgi:hypothetical protein
LGTVRGIVSLGEAGAEGETASCASSEMVKTQLKKAAKIKRFVVMLFQPLPGHFDVDGNFVLRRDFGVGDYGAGRAGNDAGESGAGVLRFDWN